MELAGNLILCVYLLLCSWFDLRKRRLPRWLLYAGLAAGAGFACFLVLLGSGTWGEALLGLLPGIVLLVYGKVTEGKLGEGDGLMVMPAGLIQQWESCVLEIMIGCMLAFAISVVMLLARKGNKDTKLPFAPLFLAAVILMWVWEAA